MSSSSRNEILMIVDKRDERLLISSMSALAKVKDLARELGGEVCAVTLGSSRDEDQCIGFERAGQELYSHGADKVLAIDCPELGQARADVYATVIEKIIKKRDPGLVAVPLTELGRELAARLAGRLDRGVISDVDRFEFRDGRLICHCPAWGGAALAEIYFEDQSAPGVVTVSTHGQVWEEKKEGGQVERLDIGGINAFDGPRLVSSRREPAESRRLEDAEIVVVGGAGMGSALGFDQARELAAALGGEVGATRPAVLAHWAGEDRMIGQTGKSIRPRLLITIGTSGAVQYTAGVMDSETIVAINRDPSAPIFELANIGVVANAGSILPLISERVRRAAMRGLADLICDQGNRNGKAEGIGVGIRRLRAAHDWTVSDLAEATGKDPDFIGKVEAGEVTPSVSFLLSLAKAFGVDPSAFLSLQEKESIQGEREKAFTTRTQNYSYQTLTPGADKQRLRAFMITIEPRQAHKPVAYKHEGEEFVYVLKGELELTLAGKETHLKPGESKHFDSEIPHKLRSLSDEPTRCLVMLYTP